MLDTLRLLLINIPRHTPHNAAIYAALPGYAEGHTLRCCHTDS